MNRSPYSPAVTPTATDPATLLAHDAAALRQRVLAAVDQVVVGAEDVAEGFLMALLSGGHVLLEGVPGVAKTTLSKVFARLLGCEYQRIQFTPDLMPSDITGTSVYDRNISDFTLRHGPIFCQVLLADEINRAPAKTQSALLEAMQEYQVTIDGQTLLLPRPFLVLATQNPVEQEGVYRLPEAQLDRFLLRIVMGYPGFENEVNMLKLHGQPTAEPSAIFTPETILHLQKQLPAIYGNDVLFRYIIELAEATRTHPDVALGASPRAALGLLRSARARAALHGRHFFTHEDVQAVAPLVLNHRIILRPETEIEGRTVEEILREVLASVPVLNSDHEIHHLQSPGA
ncbi:MAG: MoxR family ATPase [Bacteroidales bacterium]|nr:MoxR family ATPase [Bacteroidales bacterium]